VSRRWTEQEAPPPLDLRLVPAAAAVWLGSLIGLWATPAAWWVCVGLLAGLGSGGCAALVRAHGRRGSPVLVTGTSSALPARAGRGAAAALLCLLAAIALSALRVQSAAADPLVQAASRGDWAAVEVVVTADPSPVDSPFPTASEDDQTGSGGVHESGAADDGRSRVAARARRADIRGGVTTSGVTVTVFGTGGDWAAVVTGEVLRVRGVTAPDAFATVPGVTLRAVGPPEIISEPPWWSAWAVAARRSLARSASVLDP
jgi:competence protein ComEC